MPVKGVTDAKRRTRKLMAQISGPMSEKALTIGLITAQGFATLLTPADTGNLRNSQYRIVAPFTGGVRGRIGYTANYAYWVHQAPAVLRGKPRPKRNGNPTGNYWDPKARPGFLALAFEGKRLKAVTEAVQTGMQL